MYYPHYWNVDDAANHKVKPCATVNLKTGQRGADQGQQHDQLQ